MKEDKEDNQTAGGILKRGEVYRNYLWTGRPNLITVIRINDCLYERNMPKSEATR
jgi:hypothetical protein